ncbi:MAG: hypothetical protein KBH29_04720 [Lutibacter sp.]|nr:hypothetical protein [Lutibacter sp.]
MNTVKTKIAALFMTMMVLVSTLSFTISMHLCNDTVVDTGLFSRPDNCGEDQKSKPIDDCTSDEKGCCSDENFVVAGQSDLQHDEFEYPTLNNQLFVAYFVHSYLNLFQESDTQLKPSIEYFAPLIKVDAQVLFQRYII